MSLCLQPSQQILLHMIELLMTLQPLFILPHWLFPVTTPALPVTVPPHFLLQHHCISCYCTTRLPVTAPLHFLLSTAAFPVTAPLHFLLLHCFTIADSCYYPVALPVTSPLHFLLLHHSAYCLPSGEQFHGTLSTMED